MAENKTRPTGKSVSDFIASVPNAGRRQDAAWLLDVMQEITGHAPVLWGDSLIGFGQYSYRTDAGHAGEFFLTGFSPRKANMVVYIMPGFKAYAAELAEMGGPRTGASCLYLGRLTKIPAAPLKHVIKDSYARMVVHHLTPDKD